MGWGRGGVVSLVYRVTALFDVRGNDPPDGWHRKKVTLSHIFYI